MADRATPEAPSSMPMKATAGIAAVLPGMLERQSGHVITIGSIGALAVSPTASVYCATKYAVRALRGPASENDVLRVTCIHPGVVESELVDTIGIVNIGNIDIKAGSIVVEPP